jgi:hypothetical protein
MNSNLRKGETMEGSKKCPLCETDMQEIGNGLLHWQGTSCKLARFWTFKEWAKLTRAEKGGTEGEVLSKDELLMLADATYYYEHGKHAETGKYQPLREKLFRIVSCVPAPRPVLPTEEEMACDKCIHWKLADECKSYQEGNRWGECSKSIIDIQIEGDAYVSHRETDDKAFCSNFQSVSQSSKG